MMKIGDLYCTGSLSETRREKKFEWKIKDFLQLSDKSYESPEFHFCGIAWEILISPNGDTKESEGWISLFLQRKSSGLPVTVDFSFSLKTIDGETNLYNSEFRIFDKNISVRGYAKVISSSNLIEKKSKLLPSDAFTVICTIKNCETEYTAGVDRLVVDLKSLLLNGNSSDVTLKVDDREFKVHRNILMVRSPVFASMFQHDTKENITGIVDIPDCSAEAFEVFLSFVYSGKADAMSSDNVFDLCYAADKYQINDLKSGCVKYMEENLSIENICSVMTVSLQLSESGLQKAATNFFCGNVKTIIKTVEWQKYVKDYPVEANELYLKAIYA